MHAYESTDNAGPQVHDTFANSVEACHGSSNNASTDFFDAKDAQEFKFNRQVSNELWYLTVSPLDQINQLMANTGSKEADRSVQVQSVERPPRGRSCQCT